VQVCSTAACNTGVVVTLGTYPLSGGPPLASTNWSAALPASIPPGVYYGAFTYNGDSNYASVSDPSDYFQITLANSACTLVSNTPTSTPGTPVTFKVTCATAVSGGAGVPSGSVSLTDSGGSFSPQSLTLNALGVATYTTAALSAGTHNIVATYAGDANFNGVTATPNPLVETVQAANTLVVLVPSAISIPINGSIVYTANITIPANSVTPLTGTALVYDSLSATPICTLTSFSGGPTLWTAACAPYLYNNPSAPNNGVATAVNGPGSHNISLVFNSGAPQNWSGGEAAVKTIYVGSTLTTTAVPSSSAGTSYTFATATNLSTTVTPASGSFTVLPTSGTVTFYDGTTQLTGGSFSATTGVASVTGVLLTPGSHSITAQFSGDVNYASSTSTIQTIVVSKYQPGFTINPASIAVNYGSALPSSGDTVTMATAPGSPSAPPPTGTVTITAGSVVLGTFPLAGGATSYNSVAVPPTLPVGVYGVQFAYSGDGNYAANSQTLASFLTIQRIAPTCAVTSSSNPAPQNQPITFTMTCTSPTTGTPSGSVTFTDNVQSLTGAASVLMVNGIATYTTSSLQPTSHIITASYSGDVNFYPLPNQSPSLGAPTVNPQVVTTGTTIVTVAASTTTPAMGTNVTYTVTVAVPNGVPTPHASTVTVVDIGSGVAICPNVSIGGSGNSATGSCTVLYNNSGPQVAPGVHNIDAVYTSSDTAQWNSATSAPITVTAGLQATTITPVIDNPSTTAISYGTGLTFSTVVSPHTGSPVFTGAVQFVDTTGGSCSNTTPPVCVGGVSTVIGTAVPNSTTGVASIPAVGNILLSGGTHIITAQFLGDANFAQSPISASLVIVVSGVAPTVTITGGPFNVPIGGTLSIASITVVGIPGDGVPAGTVQIYSNTTLIGTATFVGNNAATATANYSFSGLIPMSLLPGTLDLHAAFTTSNTSYTNANSPNDGLIVTKTTTTTAVVSSANPSVTGQLVSFTATVTPTGFGTAPTGTVTFSVNGTNVSTINVSANGSISTATLTIPTAQIPLPDGANSIVATYNGDTNYNGSHSPNTAGTWLVQQVNPAATTITLAPSINSAVVGQGVTLTAYITVNSPGTATDAAQPTGTVTFWNTISGIPQNMGTFSIVPAPSGLANTWVATCQTGSAGPPACSALPEGQLSLTAVYSGDANYRTSTSTVLTQIVNKPTVVVVTVPNANPVIYGTAVTLTSTVTPNPPGAGTPTGNLQFYDGGTLLVTEPLVAGQATYTVTLGPGQHAIGVTYQGDANFQGYIEPSVSVLVNRIPTAISVTSSAPTAVASQVITFTAQISPNAPAGAMQPTGQVQFTSDGATIGVNTLVSGVATITVANLMPGLHQIQAIYTGDLGWAATTSAYIPETITAAQTVTQLTSSANPSVYGQQVTFTVGVAVTLTGTVPAAGQIQLYDNAVGIGVPVSITSGTATVTVPSFSPGTHYITATFIGSTSFNTSTSAALVLVVNKAPTATVLVVVPTTTTSNQSATLTAVVSVPAPGSGTPTGTVTFTDTTSGTVLGTAPLSVIGGVVTASTTTTQLNQSGGARLLTATYSGDSNFATGTSPAVPETVFGAQVAVVNNASGQSLNFAAGSIASVYGVNLAGTALSATSADPLPTSLAGTTVSITDSAGVVQQAGLYYVSPNQINLVIPSSTAFGLATLTVTNGGGSTASGVILITYTAPGIYAANQNGKGVAAAQILEVSPTGVQTFYDASQYDAGSSQYQPNPCAMSAANSYYLILYGTGLRLGKTGQVTATVAGMPATITYAGAQPSWPGLDQINLQLPSGLAGSGTVNVVVTVAGQAANTVTVAFK